MKSPLRYPGGKSRAVKYLLPLIPPGVKTLVSPFFGGGSLELAAADLGIKVVGYDSFEPLVMFWYIALNDSTYLAAEVRKFLPLSKKQFYVLQKEPIGDPYAGARNFYILNRASFSGSSYSGGMSPGHPRFTESSIQRLAEFKSPGVVVEKCQDFRESMLSHPNDFMYLDPPYLIKSTLYGNKGDTHKDFPHLALRNRLLGRKGWILSYNDCPEIRQLYEGHRIMPLSWKYGMGDNKTSKEIVIFSKDLT